VHHGYIVHVMIHVFGFQPLLDVNAGESVAE